VCLICGSLFNAERRGGGDRSVLINLLKAKKSFNDILIYILLGAGVMTAVLGKWIETCVILGVAVINAAIGFIQDGKAEQALEGIRKMLSLNAGDGEWVELD
jgi:magnesium-transporting ATPase (P-type)